MTDLCARCGKSLSPTSCVTLLSLIVGIKRFHFECIREDDTIRTLREASA